jgi:hypothetical protein
VPTSRSSRYDRAAEVAGQKLQLLLGAEARLVREGEAPLLR